MRNPFTAKRDARITALESSLSELQAMADEAHEINAQNGDELDVLLNRTYL